MLYPAAAYAVSLEPDLSVWPSIIIHPLRQGTKDNCRGAEPAPLGKPLVVVRLACIMPWDLGPHRQIWPLGVQNKAGPQ